MDCPPGPHQPLRFDRVTVAPTDEDAPTASRGPADWAPPQLLLVWTFTGPQLPPPSSPCLALSPHKLHTTTLALPHCMTQCVASGAVWRTAFFHRVIQGLETFLVSGSILGIWPLDWRREGRGRQPLHSEVPIQNIRACSPGENPSSGPTAMQRRG